MKKIIFTVTTDLNHDQRMHRICSSLQANDFEVLLIGRKKNISKPLVQYSYAQKRFNCYFDHSFLFYMEYNIRLFFFLLFHRFDVVSAVDLDTVLPAFLVSKIRFKKIVFDSHEYFTELPELVNQQRKKKIWNWIADLCLPRISTAYTVNESLADIFSEKYNVRYKTIRSITRYENEAIKKLDTHPKIILYQGALNVGRGLEVAIRSMQYLENACLELAGDGDIKNELVALVQTLDLEDKVTFLGNLSPESLALKTKQAYIGLNLLENTSLNYYYSLANKFFDYMHAEIPSINMDFPEYRKIIEQHHIGLLIASLDVDTLLEAINPLLENKQKYLELMTNTKIAKKYYSWQKEEKKLLQIYKDL